jgi:hypothetical protein
VPRIVNREMAHPFCGIDGAIVAICAIRANRGEREAFVIWVAPICFFVSLCPKEDR